MEAPKAYGPLTLTAAELPCDPVQEPLVAACEIEVVPVDGEEIFLLPDSVDKPVRKDDFEPVRDELALAGKRIGAEDLPVFFPLADPVELVVLFLGDVTVSLRVVDFFEPDICADSRGF